MTILYFTSTGNSLYVAKCIAGNLCSIPQVIHSGEFEIKDDAIGFVFPVYGLTVPPYVLDFVKQVKLQCNYLFAVITYGFYDGGTIDQLMRVAKERKLNFSYVNKVKMVENYLPGFEMNKEISKRPEEKVQKAIDDICSDIKEKKQWICHNSAFDRFMTWTHVKNYAYTCGIGMTDKYDIKNTCTSCGICSKVCPMNNIKLVDLKPQFEKKCISCLACVQNCPENAIHMINEKSEVRYRNPHISLKDIISANQIECDRQES
jgi:ferredoxin